MDQVKIGRFIAELRKGRQLTQAQLGERLGVTNKTVSRWENGNYMPDIALIPDLAAQLEISVNELIAGERFVAEDYQRGADEQLMKNLQLIDEIREIKESRWLSQGMGEVGIFLLAVSFINTLLHMKGFELSAEWSLLVVVLPVALLFGGVLLLLVMRKPRLLSHVIGVSVLPLFLAPGAFMLLSVGLIFVSVGSLGNRMYFRAIDKLLDANLKVRG